MAQLSISVDRITDASFPGFVECSFVDANGGRFLFIEKLSVVSSAPNPVLPMAGKIDVELISVFSDETGARLAKIDISNSLGVFAQDGTTEFVVALSSVSTE